ANFQCQVRAVAELAPLAAKLVVAVCANDLALADAKLARQHVTHKVARFGAAGKALAEDRCAESVAALRIHQRCSLVCDLVVDEGFELAALVGNAVSQTANLPRCVGLGMAMQTLAALQPF